MHLYHLKLKHFHGMSIKFVDVKEALAHWASGFIGY